MEDDDRIIKLKSKDDKVFELPADAAQISDLVKDSLGDSEDEIIEILRVSSETLEKVVEFLKHYKEEKMKEIPTPLGGSTFDEVWKLKGAHGNISLGSSVCRPSALVFNCRFFCHVDYGSEVVPRFCFGRKLESRATLRSFDRGKLYGNQAPS